MLSERGRGRLVGGLTFLQLVGLIVPFVLLLPIVTPPGAYLADAAASSTRVLVGVLLLLLMTLFRETSPLEDLPAGKEIEGIRVVSPFLTRPPELIG